MLRISSTEASFTRRGFDAHDRNTVDHLEQIGRVFLTAYNLAISQPELPRLEYELNAMPRFFRGFAFEGAAMGVAIVDELSLLAKPRLPSFMAENAQDHIYLVHVGIGWAFARLPWLRLRLFQRIRTFDPLLKWLILDGYGFHSGYFSPKRYFKSKGSRSGLSGYGSRAFCQGLGRSLWFVRAGDATMISETIEQMPQQMQADLWAGIGLAAAYAGGRERVDLTELRIRSGEYLPCVAQGAAFAAAARYRGGNPSEQTDIACSIFCKTSSADAAVIVSELAERLPEDSDEPAYEIWRRRIQSRFGGNYTDL